MISYIKGEVVKKGIDYLILDNNNIGYYINTSFSTLEKVSEKEANDIKEKLVSVGATVEIR